MKTTLHAAVLIAPVLGQISDPLRYVDPLIGSSNGGAGSRKVFYDRQFDTLLSSVQEMSSPAPLCLMVWQKRPQILIVSPIRAGLPLMGVMLRGKQVESEYESIDLKLLLILPMD